MQNMYANENWNVADLLKLGALVVGWSKSYLLYTNIEEIFWINSFV